jgi:DNA polymerase III subunit gamma/tau
MSYTVFALKWRPQKFDEIVGQPHIVTQLKNALEKERLAHAYLFAGPRGVGKTSTARILAKSLNCKEGPTVNPCQKCPSCKDISAGRSLDVIEIDGASNRGIDEIRTLRENVKFASALGKYKIYIIDEVHMLTSEAFNALLKTLEEPPEYVKFIFATTHPHKVLSTILSRCHRLDFRRVPVIETIGQLEKIVSAEKLDVDKDVLYAIARSSDGSLRDAESVLDQLVSFSREKVSLKDVMSVLGLVEQDALFEVMDKIIARAPREVLELFNRVIEEGKDTGVFLSELIGHMRNLMVARVSKGDTQLTDLPEEVCARLYKQSQAMTLEEIFNAFNVLINTQEMAKRLESARIALEMSLIRLSVSKRPDNHVPNPERNTVSSSNPQTRTPANPPAPGSVIARPKAEERNTSLRGSVLSSLRGPAVAEAIPSQNEPTVSPVAIEAIREKWSELIKSLEGVKISVAHYLAEGEPVKVAGNCVTVSFPKNLSLHKEALEGKDNRILIERCCTDMMKAPLRVQFILSNEEKKSDSPADHPEIQSALNMFHGRLLKEDH